MSKKHIMIIILQSVVIVILGTVLFKQKESTNFFKINEDFLKDEIKYKDERVWNPAYGKIQYKGTEDSLKKVKEIEENRVKFNTKFNIKIEINE